MKKITLAIAAIAAAFTMNAQTTVLDVSFENSNGFTLADINGQNGWISTPDGNGGNVPNQVVSDAYASDGTNSLQITDLVAEGIPQQQAPVIGGWYNFTSNVDHTNFVAEFDVYFEAAQFNTALQMTNVDGNYGAYIVFENQNNSILVADDDGAGGLTFNDTGEVWANDTWYTIKIELNGSSATYSIDGTEVYSGTNWSSNMFDGLRFNHDNAGTGNAYIDNITIQEGTLSIDNIEATTFKHYINNNILTVEANTAIENVRIFNILGQQVATQEVSAQQTDVNVSSFKAGVYLAQVQIAGKTQTFKFVKK